MHCRILSFSILLFAVLACLPSTAIAAPLDAVVVMSGLDNPRGLAFADDDDGDGATLYVAEAGRGGSGPCRFIRGQVQCLGASGAVSRLRNGVQTRIAIGLPSYAPQPSGAGATGPHDVTALGGVFVTVGLGDNPANRPLWGAGGADLGKLVRLGGNGWRVIADLAAYEAAANPDGGPVPDSNPYGALSQSGFRLVSDAGGNALLRVRSNGAISTVATFPSRPQGRGTDAVPTAVEHGPDGAYYVSELTGVPFAADAARIYRVVPGSSPVVYLTNFTLAIDLAFAPDGTLYVLEHAGAGQAGNGRVIRIEPDGTRSVAVEDLERPTSIAFGPDAQLYISHRGISAGDGEVLRTDVGEEGGEGD